MKPLTWLALLALLALCAVCAGCETYGGKPLTKGEIFVRQVNLDGVKIGDKEATVLKCFPKARRQPFGRTDREVYELPNPNSQVSLVLFYFSDQKLIKMELRYFNGPGVNALTRAGGWAGLRDYMISRFGQPTLVGPTIVLETEAGDLNAKYANFNGEWNFPRFHRKVQYIVFDGPKGGIGIVTFVDTAATATEVYSKPAATGSGGKAHGGQAMVIAPPNPGF